MAWQISPVESLTVISHQIKYMAHMGGSLAIQMDLTRTKYRGTSARLAPSNFDVIAMTCLGGLNLWPILSPFPGDLPVTVVVWRGPYLMAYTISLH